MKYIFFALMIAVSAPCLADEIAREPAIVLSETQKATTISQKDVEKTAVYDTAYINYDSKTSQCAYTLKRARGCGWKLVHDGKRVVTVQNNCGIMTTIYTIVTAKDKAAILKEIDRLGLKVSNDVAEQIEMEE